MMFGETPSDNRLPDESPAALLTELEDARAALQRADRQARTYLAKRGVLDQTYLDLAATVAQIGTDRTD